jgi:carboxylesterase
MTGYDPKAKPFFLQGTTRQALLFIHGFTASPSELYPTAELLHSLNSCTVSGILLPGHGTSPADLNKTSWEDWYQAVENEISRLSKEYENVFIAGLSMGALLALYAGSKYQDIKAIIAINTPIFTQYPIITSLAPLIKNILPYISKLPVRREDSLELKGRFAYKCYPVKAYIGLTELRNKVLRELPSIKQPTLLIQSLKDRIVRTGSAEYLKNHLTGCQVKLINLPESGHIATMENEVNIIAQKLNDFMGQIL